MKTSTKLSTLLTLLWNWFALLFPVFPIYGVENKLYLESEKVNENL